MLGTRHGSWLFGPSLRAAEDVQQVVTQLESTAAS